MVYLGVDFEQLFGRAERPAEESRRQLGIEPGQVLVLMVGHIRRWKGQHVLVQALTKLPADTLGRVRVFFAGGFADTDRDYRKELEETIDSLGFSERITFLGERENIPDLMRASDIVVHASTLPEPFGLVIVESMALGRPVVAADLGGPREIIRPGTGLTFDVARPAELAEQLDRLARDEALRSSLGERARARALDFSASRMALGIEEVYREVLTSAAAR